MHFEFVLVQDASGVESFLADRTGVLDGPPEMHTLDMSHHAMKIARCEFVAQRTLVDNLSLIHI